MSTAPWPVLSMTERRLLGVLVEKAKTTPENYPLSLNALTTGSNQKSNRDPVMNLDDEDAEQAMLAMQPRGLVTRITGGRVERWRHNLYDVWKVNKVELAVLTELLLRGAQTEGELRTRASRMEPIDDLDALREILKPLAERGLVVFLGPEGRRGTLLTHGFHAPKEIEAIKARVPAEEPAAPAVPAARSTLVAPPPALEADVRALKEEVATLRTQLQQVQETLADTRRQVQTLKEALGG